MVREVRKSLEDVSKAAGDLQEGPLDWLSVILKHCLWHVLGTGGRFRASLDLEK